MRTPINRSTAYEPQANRTTYDTVFNSDAAQMIKFEPRVWSQTFSNERIVLHKLKPCLNAKRKHPLTSNSSLITI